MNPMTIPYLVLLLVLIFRNRDADKFRRCFAWWLWYSFVTACVWYLEEPFSGTPALSLFYPAVLAMAAGEAWWDLAKRFSRKQQVCAAVFGAAMAYGAIVAAWAMPAQWNLLGSQEIAARGISLATIGIAAFMLTSVGLMQVAGSAAPRSDWMHAWLFCGFAIVRFAVYALPSRTADEWSLRSWIGLASMSAVLGAWCFIVRPARGASDPRRNFQAA